MRGGVEVDNCVHEQYERAPSMKPAFFSFALHLPFPTIIGALIHPDRKHAAESEGEVMISVPSGSRHVLNRGYADPRPVRIG